MGRQGAGNRVGNRQRRVGLEPRVDVNTRDHRAGQQHGGKPIFPLVIISANVRLFLHPVADHGSPLRRSGALKMRSHE